MSAGAEDTFGLLNAARRVRDATLEAVARVTVQITSSSPYARVTGAMVQPGLIAAGVLRKAREKAMAQLLGQLNMPSRDEVLAISQRLTNIEMVLDDLAAAVEAQRASAAQQQRAPAARVRPRGEA